MKYLLFLSVLFLSACSADSVDEETQEETNGLPEGVEFAIYLMDACPNGSGEDYWMLMDQEAFEYYLELVRDSNEGCYYLTIEDYKGVERSGYWGGVESPEDYEF